MIRISKFAVGDLVRKRSILATKNQGYGIILDLGSNKVKCLWNDDEIKWLKTSQIYLIARGQNGDES